MSEITLSAIKEARDRITPYIRRTPLLPSDFISRRCQKEVLLKCENLQRTGSFKIRGAANCVLQNLAQAKKAGVVAASAGNHAQGVAAICHHLGIRATIVMPTSTPAIKIQNTQTWGAEIRLVGNVYNDAYDEAVRLSHDENRVLIHPYRDPWVMAGQGTVGLELLEEESFAGTEAVVVSVGGGGLITGCAAALKAHRPELKIYGVTAKNAPATWKAFHEGRVICEEVRYTLAEGVATKGTDETMLEHLRHYVDEMLSISEESLALSISAIAEHGKMLVEGAGALPLAALLENRIPERKVVAIVSGGNIDLTALASVISRGLVEQGRLVRLVITIPDRPGGLNSITQILSDRKANVLQVFHQRYNLHTLMGETDVDIDLETRGRDHTQEVIDALSARGLQVRRVL